MKEKLLLWLSWKLPRQLVYWCFIRVATHDCMGHPGDRPCHEAAKAWTAAA